MHVIAGYREMRKNANSLAKFFETLDLVPQFGIPNMPTSPQAIRSNRKRSVCAVNTAVKVASSASF
ncbi:hypothetical protein PAN31117_05287 [Pandoraea anapnoica]|uniref:Uncharacterized protein n=1 Tax=Pandoraea anapnoica TaxID=2508301 RepID=A0A5E5ASD9_9BURK|nr:hypothetical protein PIN31009_05447 [Pandoraea iniqua]VVE75927.1 hypothetical protein PAN31117_05287 [Pandoraea anapnoica]